MPLRLIIEDDEGTTTIVPLGADAITIGRQQGNTIQLTEKNVSRRHARLVPEQEAWFIEDLGSYNGVKVNGSAVEARLQLKEGDVVQIGDYHLALTDNVDKSTLNYAAGQGAANDNGARGEEPVLASSSTDLPRLSSEDLAALQSGPQPVAMPPVFDSGAMPATAAPTGFEEDRKSNTGLLIGFGAVVVGALVLGFAWMARSGNEEPPATKPEVAATTASKGSKSADTKAMAGVVDPAPSPVPNDPPPPAGVVGDAPSDPEPVLIEEDEPPAATPRKPRRPRKSVSKPTSRASKTPPPTPEPAVDTKALLADARKLSMTGPFNRCYDQAKQAYSANRSAAASELMAKCACKMGDAGKAKKAASRLRGAKREQTEKLCALKGIDL